jgi:hypothetical protein
MTTTTITPELYLPGDLERQIGAFVEHYNHVRYHESINNLTRPTSALEGPRQSSLSDNASSEQLSQTDACSISCRPPKL